MMVGDGMIVGGKQQPPQGDNCIIDPVYECNKLIYCQRNQNTASPLDPRTGYHTPASRDQGFSPATVQDGGFDTPIDSLPDSTGLSSLQRSYTSDANGPESQQLSPNEMIAPASAVHSMSVNLLDTNDVSQSYHLHNWYRSNRRRSSWKTQPRVTLEEISSLEESSARSLLVSCMRGMVLTAKSNCSRIKPNSPGTDLRADRKTFYLFLIRSETHSILSVQDPCFVLR
jgi:hypothetical protein